MRRTRPPILAALCGSCFEVRLVAGLSDCCPACRARRDGHAPFAVLRLESEDGSRLGSQTAFEGRWSAGDRMRALGALQRLVVDAREAFARVAAHTVEELDRCDGRRRRLEGSR